MTGIHSNSRAAALAALDAFLSHVPTYSSQRSFVRLGYREVSRLSAFIRRRVITEQEVVRTVRAQFSFSVSQKFIQEVVWRTYWKGWLERYPEVWRGCVDSEEQYRAGLHTHEWGELYQRACIAETQLSFFNDWVRELVDTGYLHNHVRMWFASVWIFTLKIPWQLGAMFMYRHLLDGDPASNTLSWRWVAGLQTKGKFYLAREDNIAAYSEGRWQPAEGELAQSACPVLDDEVALTSLGVTRLQCNVPAQSDCGVLTSSEDLSVECDEELTGQAQSFALLRFKPLHGESGLVTQFVQEVENDACSRWGARGVGVADTDEVVAWAKDKKLSSVVIVAPAVGPDEARIAEAAKGLEQSGVACSFYRRKWDRELFGLADRGFFPFWERVKKRIEREDPLFRGK